MLWFSSSCANSDQMRQTSESVRNACVCTCDKLIHLFLLKAQGLPTRLFLVKGNLAKQLQHSMLLLSLLKKLGLPQKLPLFCEKNLGNTRPLPQKTSTTSNHYPSTGTTLKKNKKTTTPLSPVPQAPFLKRTNRRPLHLAESSPGGAA